MKTLQRIINGIHLLMSSLARSCRAIAMRLPLRPTTKSSIKAQSNWRAAYIALVTVGILLTVTAAQRLLAIQRENSAARSEYEQLRDLTHPALATQSELLPETLFGQRSEAITPGHELPLILRPRHFIASAPATPLPGELAKINSDFIGWLTIEGMIDYPVVRGSDNSEYINTTFNGQTNPAGAIFMDSRLEQGFEAPVTMLYGHNMRDGSMFAPLHRYSDAAFIADHPYITIMTLDGETLTYRIFSAAYTDVWDIAYYLNFPDGSAAADSFSGAPIGADRFLLLSTCTGSTDRDARLLVYASLVL